MAEFLIIVCIVFLFLIWRTMRKYLKTRKIDEDKLAERWEKLILHLCCEKHAQDEKEGGKTDG